MDKRCRFQKPMEYELRSKLTPLQYQVTQRGATEPPYQNPFYEHFAPGIYVDVVSGEPLFASPDKFSSGCGWPSFSKPICKGAIRERMDTTKDMLRTEVRSTLGDSHLGHVFTDGPKQMGGLRYCINSASLRFVPLRSMEGEGYGEWISQVEHTS